MDRKEICKIPGRRKKNRTELIKEMRAVEETVADLPDSYEETRLVLLTRDPYLLHVYWDIAPKDFKRVRSRLKGKDLPAQATLRFYDITYLIFDDTNPHNTFDIDININARNWYVHLWSPEKSYCVDLGLRSGEGQFFRIARSNVAEIPPACPSEKREERYMLVLGDYKRVEIVPQMPEMPPAMQPQYGLSQEARPEIEDRLPAPPPFRSFKGLNEPFESENMDKTVMSQRLTEDNENPPKSPFKKGGLFSPPLEKGGKGGFERGFSDEFLKRKLAELYRFRLAENPRLKLKSHHNSPSCMGGADLTEMNERGLPVGISSRVTKP